jgi:hypothetical protein
VQEEDIQLHQTLVVLDNVTNEKIDVILRYELGDTQVSILKNTKDLYGVIPRVIPIHNSNGIGINTISYNEVNGDVVVTLVGSFATVGGFPFTIGDKVLVENVAITTSLEGDIIQSGYNYSSFDVVATRSKVWWS